MLSTILVCFVGAMLTPIIKSFVGKHFHYVLSLIPLALFILVIEQSTWLSQTQGSSFALSESYSWFPKWNIGFDFRADGLSMLLAGLVTGVGTFISLYAGSYLKNHAYVARFYIYFFVFMGAMLGIAFSDNFYAFFMFWELTGVASYFLIGFDFHNKKARQNALQALLVTGIGGLCLLAAFVLTHHALGASTFSFLNQHASEIQNHSLFPWILALFFLGALTKSAQFPFHFWLPNAMSAPTPASAYLHSATMVKAGIFLLARVAPAFDSVPAWGYTLITLGAITVVLAAVMSLFQVDLKRLLAFTTLGALGMLTLALGIGTPLVVKSALVFMIAHGFYKAALFLIAGIVDHEAGTRDVRKLGGLGRLLPFTSVGLILAGLAKLGLPPALSFIGKENLLAGVLEYQWGPLWAIIIGLGAISFVFVGVHMIYIFFISKDQSQIPSSGVHEAPWAMWIGPLVMGFIGLFLPFIAAWFDTSILNPAYDTFLKPSFDFQLSFWHGFSWPLVISLMSVGLGYWAFTYCRSSLDELSLIDKNLNFGPSRVYEAAINAITVYTGPFFRLFQNGSLRFYLHVILWSFVGTSIAYFATKTASLTPINFEQKSSILISLVQLIVVSGAVLAVLARRIFTSILALGMVGFGLAFVFVLHGAPDLAMTQFLVETLTLILMVLILRRMPLSANFLQKTSKIFSVTLAIAAGFVFSVITYISATTPITESVSEFYAKTSLVEAYGRNVVNVILVDYRGFDTLGEIFVLALAAFGVFTLLKPKIFAKTLGDKK
jgi:multicomponent Na+:H+ antiporter subunit A